MHTPKKILIVIPILWLGFILSISFMEAWLKFQAEGVTLSIGLSIGRLVFGALNKVEIFFFLIILIVIRRMYFEIGKKATRNIMISLLAILLAQTFHLLPVLNSRAEIIISGLEPSFSYFHFYYVSLEITKVLILASLVSKILSPTKKRMKPKIDLDKVKATGRKYQISTREISN